MTIGATLGGVGSFIGGLASAFGSRSRNDKIVGSQLAVMDYQRKLQNKAHFREVRDLRRAGLNPILSAMGGPGAMSPQAGPALPLEDEVSKGISTAMAVKQLGAQLDNIESDTEVKKANEENLKVDNKLKEAQAEMARNAVPATEAMSEMAKAAVELIQYIKTISPDKSAPVTSALGAAQDVTTDMIENTVNSVQQGKETVESGWKKIRGWFSDIMERVEQSKRDWDNRNRGKSK